MAREGVHARPSLSGVYRLIEAQMDELSPEGRMDAEVARALVLKHAQRLRASLQMLQLPLARLFLALPGLRRVGRLHRQPLGIAVTRHGLRLSSRPENLFTICCASAGWMEMGVETSSVLMYHLYIPLFRSFPPGLALAREIVNTF